MKIEKHLILESTIEEFADKHNLIMEIHERNKSGYGKYYAHFKNCEINNGDILIGAFGDGNTPEEAIDNYARRISLQRIVVDSFDKNRKEIQVPKLIS